MRERRQRRVDTSHQRTEPVLSLPCTDRQNSEGSMGEATADQQRAARSRGSGSSVAAVADPAMSCCQGRAAAAPIVTAVTNTVAVTPPLWPRRTHSGLGGGRRLLDMLRCARKSDRQTSSTDKQRQRQRRRESRGRRRGEERGGEGRRRDGRRQHARMRCTDAAVG